MKFIKFISLFLGVSLFLFGVLKFVNPFKGWYSTQITNSGMGELSYAMGILGELSVGVVFILIYLFQSRLSNKTSSPHSHYCINSSNHNNANWDLCALTSNVPADVLPLKIKPPFIPGFFLLLAWVNVYLAIMQHRSDTNSASTINR